jgi:crossover junction endodeoxyribonuclease RuvC
VRIFGIDPGSARTGYGCVETDGSRHHIVICGAIQTPALGTFPEKLRVIHTELARLIGDCRPDGVAIENLFHAANVRSALKLGHARGVAMLAAVEAGVPVFEYTPAEIKRAVVGYGRAEKQQVQQMVKLILGLSAVPSPHDAADALAVAICHVNTYPPARVSAAMGMTAASPRGKAATSWRQYRPAFAASPLRPGKPAFAAGPLRPGKPAGAPVDVRRGKSTSAAPPLRRDRPARP